METIITAVITFMLGYITGVWLPLKFRKEDKEPKISISPFQERKHYFDITNHGGDILNLQIKISWLQDGIKQTREMINFFNSTEDPTFGYPHSCNALKKGETKKVTNCPLYSDDGKIEVHVNGVDVTNKVYEEMFVLKNSLKK